MNSCLLTSRHHETRYRRTNRLKSEPVEGSVQSHRFESVPCSQICGRITRPVLRSVCPAPSRRRTGVPGTQPADGDLAPSRTTRAVPPFAQISDTGPASVPPARTRRWRPSAPTNKQKLSVTFLSLPRLYHCSYRRVATSAGVASSARFGCTTPERSVLQEYE